MLYLTGENVSNDIFYFLQKVIVTVDDEKIIRLLWVDKKPGQLPDRKDFVICIDPKSFKVFVSYLKRWGCSIDKNRTEYNDCKITIVDEYNEYQSSEYPYIVKASDFVYAFLNNGVYDLNRCVKFLDPTWIVQMAISMKIASQDSDKK